MLTFDCGLYGFDFSTPWFGLILTYGDCEVRVWKHSVAIMWDGRGPYTGLNILRESPTESTVWYWDEPRWWFKRG